MRCLTSNVRLDVTELGEQWIIIKQPVNDCSMSV